jgi:hydroxymethylpyrimidine/phosphomethylpyrimidine kinase
MNKPNILVIAGHDPSGGAGIQADIEAIHSLGGFAGTLITGLTVQNSHNVTGFELVDIDLLLRQTDALLEDMDFQAVKIGMTGSPVTISLVADVIDRLPGVPVVLDPVLAAEAGGSLTRAGTDNGDSVPAALMRELAPRCTVATPNLPEAQQLSGEQLLETAGRALTETGCPATLITGSHDETPGVHNHLFTAERRRSWEWERLQGSFHGSGCTLSSAIATFLGRGEPLEEALELAQRYTQAALARAWQPGGGQLVPDRRHG